MLAVIMLSSVGYAQDLIVRTAGDSLNCKIISKNDKQVDFEIEVDGEKISIFVSMANIKSIVPNYYLKNSEMASPFWKVFPIVDEDIVYSGIVVLDSTYTSDMLFKAAKLWMVDHYKSAKDVIQNEDSKNYIIIGKGFFELGHDKYVRYPKVWQTVKIECKNGKYKYTIYNFRYQFSMPASSSYTSTPSEFDFVLIDWGGRVLKSKWSKGEMTVFAVKINEHISLTIESLKTYMSKKEESW